MGLDLARLDPKAAQLDLLVIAAKKVELPVGAFAADIARAIHARTWKLGGDSGQETLCRQLWPTAIAASDAGPGDDDLAGFASGQGIAVRIQDQHVEMTEGPADSDRRYDVLDHPTGRRYGDLSRAIAVEQHAVPAPALYQRGWTCFTAERDGPGHPRGGPRQTTQIGRRGDDGIHLEHASAIECLRWRR
jgi:hypothetical protein